MSNGFHSVCFASYCTSNHVYTYVLCLFLKTAGKIKSMYEVSIPNKETINAMAMPAFDAVLTAAMALNKSIAPLEAMNLSLESFNFLNHDISEKMARVIHDKLANEVTFVGASVREIHYIYVVIEIVIL